MRLPKWKVIAAALAALLVLAIAIGSLVTKSAEKKWSVYMNAVMPLKSARVEGGHWVGDVTELYRLGVISRELAEADSAPLKPLVDRPRPYNGYFVRAMLSGPSMTSSDDPNTDTAVSFSGQTINKETSAFCIYPADEHSSVQRVWIVCPLGIFGRTWMGGKPVLKWPTTADIGREWGIWD